MVTRDHGSERLLSAAVENPTESETVARVLDREAEIETSYGGNFVQSIEGIEGDGRSDWFFYVNGYWSPVGAAEAKVEAGDRIWWDYRRWDAAYRVPVVVGSWPAPFSSEPAVIDVDCYGQTGCAEVTQRMAQVTPEPPPGAPGGTGPKVVVGLWSSIPDQGYGRALTSILARGPAASGVYIDVSDDGELVPLGEDGEPARGSARIDGLVAAVRLGEGPLVWIVTGQSTPGLKRAAASLTESTLADRYALAVDPDGHPFSLPVVEP